MEWLRRREVPRWAYLTNRRQAAWQRGAGPIGPVSSAFYCRYVTMQEGPWSRRPQPGASVVRARLFLVSYAPLLGIFALQANDTREQWIFAAAGVLAATDGGRLVRAAHARTPRLTDVEEVTDKGGEVAGYLATYLLPFIGGPPTTLRGGGAYLLYFGVAFLVSTRADTGLINPTMYLFGYRIAAATVRGRRVLIVCKGGPLAPGRYPLVRIMGGAGYVMAAGWDATEKSPG